ncbi:PLDc N-terminal domain-containing protein [Halobellus captivus]|uniref:PLDc N-terminal domain-containing protein n=1 Tax=Halobellus captivus TaxID=2592614 RepID=UPI00119D835F|nr:PLDc N-terminal domain-containing protein [Halobellus captivus]
MPSSILLQGAVGTVGVLIGLLFLAVGIAMVVWTYTDAKKNSAHPAFLWALVVFFAPILGILLYVLLGRSAR